MEAARSKLDKARTELEAAVPAAGKPGGQTGNRNAAKDGNESRNAPVVQRPSDGSRERRIAQLRKAGLDDLAQAVIDRKISAHAAAIEAGLIKVKSPLDQALAAFQRLSPDDRVKFMESWFKRHIHDNEATFTQAAEEKAKELAADPEPKPGNPTGANQYGKPDKERKGADLHNSSSQQSRAETNGISIRHQKTLDKIAKLAPDYLPRIAAKEISKLTPTVEVCSELSRR